MRKYYYITVLMLILPFIINANIYKYKINQQPQGIESGRYFDNGGISIGFSRQKLGTSIASLEIEGYEELTEQQYVDYVKAVNVEKDGIALTIDEKGTVAVRLLEDKKKQFGEIVEPIPTPVGQFRGKNVYTKKDVQRIAMEDIANSFSAREGNVDRVGDQLKIIGELISLLLAYQGKITFSQCGIQGVIDTTSADSYVSDLYNTLWSQRNSIRQQAKQFIIDNNLQ